MSSVPEPRLRDYLEHMLQAIERISRYTTGMDRTGFTSAEQTQDAVIRNFEIIGEAARNIERRHPEFTLANADIPWKFAYEMRNALSHGYFKVDLQLVWDTIHGDLPTLESQLRRLLTNLTSD